MPAFIPANGAVEAAISIAVLVIAFIGWLMQIIGQAKGNSPNAPANRPRPAGPRDTRPAGPRDVRPAGAGPRDARPQAGGTRDDRLRSEIDAFLREVSGGRATTAPEENEVALEVLPDEEESQEQPRRLVSSRTESVRRETPPPQRTPAPPSPPPTRGELSSWDREQSKRRDRVLSELSKRHLASTSFGRDLQEHIEQSAAESHELRQEKEKAERRLAETRAELRSVRAEVAAGSAFSPVASVATGNRFAALLRSRNTVKDAIVVNEILSRPRVLRRS